MNFGEGTYTGVRADIQVAGNGGYTHIEPVGVTGGQLLEFASLYQGNPFWALYFSRFQQELSKSSHEDLLVNILH